MVSLFDKAVFFLVVVDLSQRIVERGSQTRYFLGIELGHYFEFLRPAIGIEVFGEHRVWDLDRSQVHQQVFRRQTGPGRDDFSHDIFLLLFIFLRTLFQIFQI